MIEIQWVWEAMQVFILKAVFVIKFSILGWALDY
jgi:hypothetical protein